MHVSQMRYVSQMDMLIGQIYYRNRHIREKCNNQITFGPIRQLYLTEKGMTNE